MVTLLQDSERYRRRDPWDCKSGECEYGDPQLLPDTNVEFRECVKCDWRVFRRIDSTLEW